MIKIQDLVPFLRKDYVTMDKDEEWSLEKNDDGTYNLLRYDRDADGFATTGVTKLTGNNIMDIVLFTREHLKGED